ATDIADNTGIALFGTANPQFFTPDNVIDAVGYGQVAAPFFEGTRLAAIPVANKEHSFARMIPISGDSGLTDTDNNAADFVLIATDGNATYPTAMIGAPGPENLSSPRASNSLTISLVDPLECSNCPPNRIRLFCGNPGAPPCPAEAQTSTNGYLSILRKFTNTTKSTVTRLRFRIIDITNITNPGGLDAPVADLRAISSPNVTLDTALGQINVFGTTLETPPTQAMGGAVNSTLSAEAVTLGAPLAPGAEINVQFLLGVKALGRFRFFIVAETLP
ncbi:MAG TPA: hypothetical protein VD966_10400, partial [Pyrinomonadaceae bacterium]|nr:hypothetical protein [Pyrinomonadaceae bacterium]